MRHCYTRRFQVHELHAVVTNLFSCIKLYARSFLSSENWCPEIHKRVFILRNTHRVTLNSCKISAQTHARVYSCKILLLFVELNSIRLGQSETEKSFFNLIQKMENSDIFKN